MKIEETPFQFNGNDSGSYKNVGPQGALEDADIRFLEMMMTLSSATTNSVLKGRVETAAASADAPADEDTAAAPLPKNVEKAKAEMSKLYDEISRVRVNHELEMLQTELTTGDIKFLEQVLIAGLPFQGGVPFQQMIGLDAQGRPEFNRLSVSEGLTAMLEKAYKSGRPVRVELDNQSSVVLKFHDGKVSAQFLTQDPGMALYLKQYLDELRDRLASKDLPVADLSYKEDDGQSGRQGDKASDAE